MSRGVARKTGECSQVQVSEDVTGRPRRWLAEAAHRPHQVGGLPPAGRGDVLDDTAIGQQVELDRTRRLRRTLPGCW